MRPTLTTRMTRRGRLLAGAMMITIPAAIPVAQALAASPTPQGPVPAQALAASPTPQDPVPGRVNAHRIAFNHPVIVTGSLSSADAGHRLALDFQTAGQSAWRVLASTTAGLHGHYRLAAPLRRSGNLRVIDATSAGPPVPLAQAHEASAPRQIQHIAVAASLRVTSGGQGALVGQRLSVSGSLRPELAGRTVRLQSGVHSRWTTVATARTRRHGGFTLHFAPASGTHALRVEFSGDRLNTASTAPAGNATGFERSVASWYYDGGHTACGFHATYGVANKSLPCGTHVTFSYGGRTVLATVDDRGPYVGGRTWDLNENTAAALRFAGVGTVWDAY